MASWLIQSGSTCSVISTYHTEPCGIVPEGLYTSRGLIYFKHGPYLYQEATISPDNPSLVLSPITRPVTTSLAVCKAFLAYSPTMMSRSHFSMSWQGVMKKTYLCVCTSGICLALCCFPHFFSNTFPILHINKYIWRSQFVRQNTNTKLRLYSRRNSWLIHKVLNSQVWYCENEK